MDFDLTQAIPLSDVESDVTDDLDESQSKKPIGYIKALKQKGFPEESFPIYEGINLIGRGDAANVLIPLKALSKEHACIEADGDSIFIYDKGSRNKTRRGKLFLKPNVRYELKDNDKLIFGDVKCEFLINHGQEEAKDDDMGIESNSGSETGSECMLQINVVLPGGSSSGVTDTKSKSANNNVCIMSPDKKQTNKRTASETFVEESFLEDQEKKDADQRCETPSVSSNYGEHQFGNAAKRLCCENVEKQLLENRKLLKDIKRQQDKFQCTLDAIMVALNCHPVQLPIPSAKLRPEVEHADSEGYINLGGNKIIPPLLFSLDVYKELLIANPKPTLLLKSLMGILFSKEEMATSNYGGKKGKRALDERTIEAIISQIGLQFSSTSILTVREIRNAINDRCRYVKFTLK